MNTHRFLTVTLLLSVNLFACTATAVSPPAQPDSALDKVSLTPAFTQLAFQSPVFLTAVPQSNRLAIAEQPGRIKVFENSQSAANAKTVLDMTNELLFRGEQGLLGLAFDPAFKRNRYVYLNYSMKQPRRNVISRMTWDESTDTILPESEKILLEIKQPYSNHNGGMLAFGPDGFLYIGVGDGGSGGDPQGHGQNRKTLLGNILRIDVHPSDANASYEIPASNPFQNVLCCRPEIYSYGWRNPYRFSFDRSTNELWVPDVGQNAIEEINIVKRGGNYGWKAYEGTQIYSGAISNKVSNDIKPVYEYGHDVGRSITGGYVYRGDAAKSLQGKYVYADFVSGKVWALELVGDTVASNTQIGAITTPTSFGEDASGEVYVVSYKGDIYKIVGKQ